MESLSPLVSRWSSLNVDLKIYTNNTNYIGLVNYMTYSQVSKSWQKRAQVTTGDIDLFSNYKDN